MDRIEFRYFLLTLFCVAYVLSKMNVLSVATFRITKFQECPAPDSKFHSLVDISLEDCVKECTHRKSCNAAGYKRLYRLCELHGQETSPPITDKYCVMVLLDDVGDRPSLSNCDEMSTLDVETEERVRKECPPEQNYDNITFLGNMNGVNAKKIVQCRNGYFETSDENSEKTIWCTKHGNWTSSIKCEECPKDEGIIGRFQFFTTKEKRSYAKSSCFALNATLVRIKDEKTFKFIKSIIYRCMDENLFWMDGENRDDIWKYSDDDDVPSENLYWHKNANKATKKETCLRIKKKFNVVPCDRKIGYICELMGRHSAAVF